MLTIRNRTFTSKTLLGNTLLIALLSFSACSRSRLPAFSEAKTLQGRADYFKGLPASGELEYVGSLFLKEGKNMIGPPGSDFAYPPLHTSVELNRSGDAVTLGHVPGEATLQGPGTPTVAVTAGANVPVMSASEDHMRWLQIGNVKFTLFAGVGKSGRLRVAVADEKTDAALHFHALSWYPPNAAYWVHAKWVPLTTPHTFNMERTNNGIRMHASAPGYVEFLLQGKTMRLYPTMEGDKLFFVFRDLTSETTTYQGSRFLTIDPVRDRALPPGVNFNTSKPTEIVVDFNSANNPACAYNPYTSCPIAPPENRLPVAIEAGEKRYHP